MKGVDGMYINKGSGLMQYETFDELLSAKINEITEDSKNYYIDVLYDDPYNNTMWIVDKRTERVSQMSLIDYMLNIMDNTKPVDPETLKRAG